MSASHCRTVALDSVPALESAFRDASAYPQGWRRWQWRCLEEAVLEAEWRAVVRSAPGGTVVIGAGEFALWTGPGRERLSRACSWATEAGLSLWLETPDFHAPVLLPVLSGHRGEFRARTLRCHLWETRPGKWRKRRFDSAVLLALAAPLTGQAHLSIAGAVDVASAVRRFETPRGLRASLAYRVFVFTVEESPHADPLCDGAVDAYIGHVLGGLRDAAGEAWGRVVQGLLVPAPRIDGPGGEQSFPWPQGMLEEFAEAHGYALAPQFPALVADTGVGFPRVRRQYWETVASCYERRTLAPLRQWCHANQVAIAFVPPRTSGESEAVRACVDPALLAAQSDIGIVREGPQVRWAAKVAQCARESGRAKTTLLLANPEANGGQDLVARRRALGAQCAAFGLAGAVLPMTQSALDFPDGELLRAVAGLEHRQQCLTGAGHRRCQVALLRPVRSLWAHFHPEGADPLFDVVTADLRYVAEALTALGFDFDLIDETALSAAEALEGRLAVGESAYELLVLPSVTYLPEASWQKVMAFVRSEGKVALFGVPPRESERGLDEEYQATVAADALIDADYVYGVCCEAGEAGEGRIDSFPTFREDHSGGRLCSFQPRLCADQGDAQLRVLQILVESLDREVEGMTTAVRCQHRRLTDANLYVLANLTAESVPARLRVRRTGRPEQWVPDCDEAKECLEYSIIEDSLSAFKLTLAPHEVQALTVAPGTHTHVDGASFTVRGLVERPGGLLTVSGYALRSGKAAALFEPAQGRSGWAEDVVPMNAQESDFGTSWSWRFLHPNRLPVLHWVSQPGRLQPSLAARLSLKLRRGWARVEATEQIPRPATVRTEFRWEGAPGELWLCLSPEALPVESWLNGAAVTEGVVGDRVRLPLGKRVRSGRNELVVAFAGTGEVSPNQQLWLEGEFDMSRTDEAPILTRRAATHTGELSSLLSEAPFYRGALEACGRVEVPPGVPHHELIVALADCPCPVELLDLPAEPPLCWTAPHRFNLSGALDPGQHEIRFRFQIAGARPDFRALRACLLALPPVHLTFDPAGVHDVQQVGLSLLAPDEPSLC